MNDLSLWFHVCGALGKPRETLADPRMGSGRRTLPVVVAHLTFHT